MINPDLFLAYILAASLLIIFPGPIVSLVIAQSLAHGRSTGLTIVAGASLGTGVLILLGALGLTTLLVGLSHIFDWVRWAGAAWLIWLGISHWRKMLRPVDEAEISLPPGRTVFWQGFLVGATNPKTILFYAAFFPQFLDPALPIGGQVAIMSIAFLAMALLLDGSYAVLAGRIRPLLIGRKQARVRDGITGTLLVGTGIGLSFMRKGG
jgi:homoserine/homoserine lactone efflux protein